MRTRTTHPVPNRQGVSYKICASGGKRPANFACKIIGLLLSRYTRQPTVALGCIATFVCMMFYTVADSIPIVDKKPLSGWMVSAMSLVNSKICIRQKHPMTKTVTDHTIPTLATTERALAQLIVETLNLDVDAASIDVNAPLFGDGLGLNSIDMLEIALAVSQTYGVKLRADDTDNSQIFHSLASLNQYIQQHRI